MDIVQIAETISTEFQAAVKAAENAKAVAVDDIGRRMDEIEETRQAGLAKVRKMREEAARILSDSLAVEEQTEAAYRAAQRQVRDSLAELRGSAPALKPVTGKRAMRTIEGGKTAAEG